MTISEELEKVISRLEGVKKAYRELVVHEAMTEAAFMQARVKWYERYRSRLEKKLINCN